MAKSTVAAATRTAEELKNDLKRLVKAIGDDDDVKAETFEEASKALSALRDLKFSGTSNGMRKRNGAVESAKIPERFLCPISSEIMKDPVVLASGQTYDRPFIQEWLNSGNRTCPQTQQVLTNLTLTPNLLVRSMISEWCTEHGISLPSPNNYNNPDEPPITVAERKSVSALLNNLSSSTLPVKKQAVKDLRLMTKQNSSVRAFIGQDPEAIPQLLSLLSTPHLDADDELLEDTVTTLLNISIFERNKKILGDDSRAIPLLIGAASTGKIQTRGNAAAALFSLSALDSNKIKIGELGAMKPLLDLLENGTLQAKKDAANAIFNLCTNGDNRARAVKEGIARVLMSLIMGKFLVAESLTILAMVSSHKKAAEEIVELDGLACLLQIVRETSCARNKENTIVIIYSVCVDHRMKLREVGEEENFFGTISDVLSTGTSRARRKATGILERLRRTMHNTHYSC